MIPFCIVALSVLAASPARSGRVEPSKALSALQPSSLRARLATTASLFRAERYEEAEKQSEELVADAVRAGDVRTAARATGNLGGIRFALHRYRTALASLLEARRLAVSMGDTSETAALDANLCSLYMEMGDLNEASRRVESVLNRLSGAERAEHLAETQILLAQLRARQKRMPDALALFHVGIAAADAKGDWKLAAFAWNRLGEEYLKQSDLQRAEQPLLEAYRIRKLRNLPLDTSYRNLGRLRLEQGDLESAGRLLDRAVELASAPEGPIPTWDAYHYRGRVRAAQGRLEEAMADLRTAVRLARAWRWSAPPDDAIRIGAEGWLDRVYSALIETGNQLYQQTGDPALIRETFEAGEENRANSLRVLVQGRIRAAESLPASYWPAVSRLQRAEVRAARLRSPEVEQDALAARAALSDIEAAAFTEPGAAAGGLLARLQAQLGPQDALLSFHLGDSASYLWAVDRDRIRVLPLPGRRAIDELATGFAIAVQNGSPDLEAYGPKLYRALFGGLPQDIELKRRWLLALDGPLFQAPFAVLPSPDGDALVQRREIEIIPGAAFWSNRLSETPGHFLGVGDAIYNAADPRRRQRAGNIQLASFAPLPRLAGSAAEIEMCARNWRGGYELLEGPAASRTGVSEALSRNPGIIHFATHFVTSSSSGSDSESAIALSLDSAGAAEILGPSEIASLRVKARLVTLSGCDSSAGAVLPGSGLLGLTRAWLASGAKAVLATHWAVPDDSGPFFEAFYRHLGLRRSPAAALRAAQLEMAASAGWRANPRYWGAYFVIGEE